MLGPLANVDLFFLACLVTKARFQALLVGDDIEWFWLVWLLSIVVFWIDAVPDSVLLCFVV